MFRYNSNSFLSFFSFLYVHRSSKYLIKIFLMKKTMNTFSLGWYAITHLQICFRVAVRNAGTFLCDRDNTSHFRISNFSSHFCINKDKLLLYPPDFIHFNDSHEVAKTLFFSLTNGQIYTVTLLELQLKF